MEAVAGKGKAQRETKSPYSQGQVLEWNLNGVSFAIPLVAKADETWKQFFFSSDGFPEILQVHFQ